MSTPKTRLERHKALAAITPHGQPWQALARQAIKLQISEWKENTTADADGKRWIDNPRAFGLRFVGYADEVCTPNYAYRYGIEHTGWHTDEDGLMETVRGAVYQLPGKNGRARYIAGYADPYNSECVRVDLSEIFESAPRLEYDAPSYCAAARDAARRADYLAEMYAEEERQYNAMWEAGRMAAQHREEASTTRRDLIEALAEHRQERHRESERPKLCAMFRKWVRDQLEYIRDQQANARELIEAHGEQDAFREGLSAGI